MVGDRALKALGELMDFYENTDRHAHYVDAHADAVRLRDQRAVLLAACRYALDLISDGVMEQVREDGQPTKAAERASRDTLAHLRAAINRAEVK